MGIGHIHRKIKQGHPPVWRAVIDIDPDKETGKRKQKTKSFQTHEEAVLWLRQMANRKAREKTTSDFYREWLAQNNELRASTLRNLQIHMDRHLLPTIGEIPLREVTKGDIHTAISVMRERGLKVATINRVLASGSRLFEDALAIGLVETNLFKGSSLKAHEKFSNLSWTLREAQEFLTSLDSDQISLLFQVLLLTGMRRGEALSLRWSNVDLKNGTIVIRENLTYVSGKVSFSQPKSRNGSRTIHLDYDTLRRLKIHKLKSPASTGDFVFMEDGHPLLPHQVSRAFVKHLEEHGLKLIRLHDLRHTSATLGLAAGESIKEISVRLGHSDISITSKVYVDVPDSLAKQSSNNLSKLLNERRRAHA